MIDRTLLAGIQLPPLVLALAVAEAFFKFHSFTLETLAFLGLWYALRTLYATLERRLGRIVVARRTRYAQSGLRQ